jgi:hypothetical protein
VGISRGRKSVRIFTPDKAQLRTNVARSGDRPLAMDLKPPRNRLQARRHILLHGARPRVRSSNLHGLHAETARTQPLTETNHHAMSQSSKEAATTRLASPDRVPACWARERGRDCLRIETLEGEPLTAAKS